MLARTHLFFGIFLGLIFVKLIEMHNPILFVVVAAIAALIPDADHQNSKIGRWFIFSRFMKHRGFLHTIFAVILFAFILLLFNAGIYILAFVIGYLSHLIIDMLTYQGIALIHPFSKTRIKGFIKTGKIQETMIYVILLLADIILLIKL